MIKATGAQRLLVVVSIVAAGLGLAAPPAGAVPALAVTPATGLLDGAFVEVEGTGLAPGEEVLVVQCAGAAPDGCLLDPPINHNAALATATSAGTIQVTLRLPRVLERPGGDVDCSAGTCAIAVVSPGGDEERARTPIDFEPTGSAPVLPDASIQLATGALRANGGSARISGAGFVPWHRVSQVAVGAPVPTRLTGITSAGAHLDICTPPPAGWGGCERYVSPPTIIGSGQPIFRYHRLVGVDAGGEVVPGPLQVPRMWDTDGGRIDCAVADCSFALDQDDVLHSNVAEVAWAPEWSPYPSASAFVAAAYPALLGRVATASERTAAIAGLTNRTRTGFDLLLDLAGRSDARPLAELTRLYLAALGRRPDASGLVYWERELRRTGSMSAIAVAFGRSPEFRQVFGSVSDRAAVDLAYHRTLGRTPSTDERAYWVGRLQAGLARTHMIHLFSRTPEYLTREGGRSRVVAITVALLRRGPTESEFWQVGYDSFPRDVRGAEERVDDGVLLVLSSNQLTAEVGS